MQEVLVRVEHVAPQESRVQPVACDERDKLVLGVLVALDHLPAGDRGRRPIEARRVVEPVHMRHARRRDRQCGHPVNRRVVGRKALCESTHALCVVQLAEQGGFTLEAVARLQEAVGLGETERRLVLQRLPALGDPSAGAVLLGVLLGLFASQG